MRQFRCTTVIYEHCYFVSDQFAETKEQAEMAHRAEHVKRFVDRGGIVETVEIIKPDPPEGAPA